MITTTSPAGRAFLRTHEGNPLTCYLDPVGVPTIGQGFTMRSRACREALAKIGIKKLIPGKTKITAAQSDKILAHALAAEFEPAVVRGSPDRRKQHEMDAGASVVYNLGTGAMKWNWAKLWRAGKLTAHPLTLRTTTTRPADGSLPGWCAAARKRPSYS